MEHHSARFEAEIGRSHHVIAYVDVVGPNQERFRLDATGGSVQVDRTAQFKRRCTVACVDQTGTLTPRTAKDILTPYGTEIRPYRGVQYDDGAVEVMPLGVFRIAKSTVSDTGSGSPAISLEAYDLSRTVSRDKFTTVYTVPVGTNIVTAIKGIVERTVPDALYDSVSTAVVTTGPLVYDVTDDPWDAATKLAVSIGCELFFNAIGWVVIAPPVDIDSLPDPDFRFAEGNGTTMIDLDTVFTDEPGFNGVVLTGESVGDSLPPVRSVVWDAEPSSPTYHQGPYGEVPLVVTDSNVKTQAQADAAAAALLAGMLGFSSQVSLTASVNPALDCGDVVEIIRQRSGVAGSYAVDTLTIPLDAKGTQSIGVRQKRTVA